MGQNSIDHKFEYDMYTRKKELFYCLFEFYQTVDEVLFVNFLMLIDEHFPDYEIHVEGRGGANKSWRDIVLSNELAFPERSSFSISLNLSFFVQQADRLSLQKIPDAVTFSFMNDESKNKRNLLFNFYADVITDKRYELDAERNYFSIDQSKAASCNRKKVAEFLMGVERFLSGEIVEYLSDNYLLPKSIYKYGFTAEAAYLTDHMDLEQ